ncbi:hypothetical protein UA08_04010 [Talaromyces atroroseus]|uniref:Zn(2)-C6 fungal-type domain-containing protein n=1 Tax=Talaromyces atroroseus TaxID=1441469 RepID=A0A1Q5Q9L9_TALAT|nr:hypothetical protein UA08_04010 [Talaromyces atroroseus]OKL60650.1 hypothetical protein UA08_04010 [Talaromyces atroroseus]
MDSTNTEPLHSGRARRSPLACLPCRSRHLKCDGMRPSCSRCAEISKECRYARSRRGGLDRAALAERRKRLEAADNDVLIRAPSLQRQDFTSQTIEASSYGLLRGISISDQTSSVASPLPTIISHGDSIENDSLIDSYYKNFHKLHPFLLPRKHMARLCQDPSKRLTFKPLIATMRLVGHIYHLQEWSVSLKDYAEACFSQTPSTDPIMVQCRLLYSMALFWHEYKDEAKSQINTASRIALDLEMFSQGFAAKHGADDPILRESWRRTWWMLYIVDAYYAGTLGTMNFEVVNIESTVDLPCEECEYESGDIPEPRTLQEFDCREFSSDNTTFSSFAYLIGAVQCAALAISTVPKIAAKEDSTQVLQAADSSLNAWLLLLPKDRKQVMDKHGKTDELMFQAHLLIHVATIGLHRPFSDLKFNPVEAASSCAREPPLDTPTPDLVNVHTVRVLRAVEAQIRLLALPVQSFHHTPFTTCMISEGTLALLSACNFLLNGKELTIAREQIRMAIGCLKTLGELWPRTARNVKEIQTIAHHVLSLGSNSTSKINVANVCNVPDLSGGEGQGSLTSETGVSSDDINSLPALGSIDDLCGWYNLDDIDTALSWGHEP